MIFPFPVHTKGSLDPFVHLIHEKLVLSGRTVVLVGSASITGIIYVPFK